MRLKMVDVAIPCSLLTFGLIVKCVCCVLTVGMKLFSVQAVTEALGIFDYS